MVERLAGAIMTSGEWIVLALLAYFVGREIVHRRRER
jgi:hypothetical protein